MKKSLAILGIIGLIVCFSFTVMTGCAKKSSVKEQAVSAEDKAAAEKAAKEAAMREAARAKETPVREAEVAPGPEATAAAVKEEMTFKDALFDFDKFSLNPKAETFSNSLQNG